MLVLSRLKEEKVIITLPEGYKGLTEEVSIDITVVEIRGVKVRLGFEAATEIIILRSELLEERKEKSSPLMFIPMKGK